MLVRELENVHRVRGSDEYVAVAPPPQGCFTSDVQYNCPITAH